MFNADIYICDVYSCGDMVVFMMLINVYTLKMNPVLNFLDFVPRLLMKYSF